MSFKSVSRNLCISFVKWHISIIFIPYKVHMRIGVVFLFNVFFLRQLRVYFSSCQSISKSNIG